jgi:hypothetical protein
MRHLVAGLVLAIAAVTAGCSAGASASPDAAVSSSLPPSNAAPSPTTGYCGMDPEPVPCVDRPSGTPGPTSAGAPFPLAGTCTVQLHQDRCEAMAVWAAGELGVAPEQVVAIDIAPPTPDPGVINHDHPVPLIVRTADGTRHDITLHCVGIDGAYRVECMADPRITLGIPAAEGYRDFPENASPVPAPDPAAVAAATAFEVDRLEVRIGAPGEQRIVIGRVGLANGIVREMGGTLEDDWPDDVVVGGARLELQPVDGEPPITNIYEHGWRPGVEQVDVVLVFRAQLVRPGAGLVLLDVVVR